MITKDEILKAGYVDVKVYVAGVRQGHRLYVTKESSKQGVVTYLDCKTYIPQTELVRLAEELQLPVRHKTTLVLPRGKMMSAFIDKDEVLPSKHIGTAEADVIEAELEE